MVVYGRDCHHFVIIAAPQPLARQSFLLRKKNLNLMPSLTQHNVSLVSDRAVAAR